MVKNLTANAGDVIGVSSILGYRKSPGGGNGYHSCILAWRIPWMEEPGGLYSPWGCTELNMTKATWHTASTLISSISCDMHTVHLIIQMFKNTSPGDSSGKESACSAGDSGSFPGLGRSPGEGNGNPLKYACLENSKDGGAWRATVMGSQRFQHN